MFIRASNIKSLCCRYAELLYNGFWFSPERLALQAAIDETQKFNSGTVRLKLYKVLLSTFNGLSSQLHGCFTSLLTPAPLICLQGNVIVVGRKSPYSLYDEKIASFEDDGGLYDQKDAAGFIKLQALRLRTLGVNRTSVSGR